MLCIQRVCIGITILFVPPSSHLDITSVARDKVLGRGDPGRSAEHRAEQGQGTHLEIRGVLRTFPAGLPSPQCWAH